MNEDETLSPDDPRLTAYALGELEPGERVAVEAYLRDHPQARQTVEVIRRFGDEVKVALASEALLDPGLSRTTESRDPETAASKVRVSDSRRESGRVARMPTFANQLLKFPRLYYVIGGLAAACVGVLAAFRERPATISREHRVVAVNMAPPTQYAEKSSAEPNAESAEPAQLPATDVADTETSKQEGLAADIGKELVAARSNDYTQPVEAKAASRRGYGTQDRFVDTARHRVSGFAPGIDVESYLEVRQSIRSGLLPAPDAVKTEQLINFFSYNYSRPSAPSPLLGSHGEANVSAQSAAGANGAVGSPDAKRRESAPFSTVVEVAAAPWAPGHRLVRIGIQGQQPILARRGPASIVFLVDVSASMNAPDRLPLARQSIRRFVARLRPEDRVAIVAYSSGSKVVLPAASASESARIAAALDGLEAGGATNAADGIRIAYEIARANFVRNGINRVILCTDGGFNAGPAAEEKLAEDVERYSRSGIVFRTLGFGADRFGRESLAQLAARGGGEFATADSFEEAVSRLDGDIGERRPPVATRLDVRVEFNPARIASYRLIGYEDAPADNAGVTEKAPSGGALAAGQQVTALYEIVPAAATRISNAGTRYRAVAGRTGENERAAASSDDLMTVTVRYRVPASSADRESVTPVRDPGTSFPRASPDLKFAAAVAAYGMMMHDSPGRGHAAINDVIAWAESGIRPGSDPGGFRADFVDLARRTGALME